MDNQRMRRFWPLVLPVAALLALAFAGSARAAIFVANSNDSGPGSLRQVIAEAPPGETIMVPADTYTLTSGELKVAKSLTISGQGAGSTIVRAGGEFRVLSVAGPGLSLTLDNLTIRDGHPQGGIVDGGGILAQEASLTLRGVSVTNNVADAGGGPGESGGISHGGGIAISDEGALTILDSSVAANTATSAGGSGQKGGIADGGGIAILGGSFTIQTSTLEGNLADASGGEGPASGEQFGGIAQGGGFYGTGASSTSNIAASTVNGNTADSSAGPGANDGIGSGGGLYLTTGGAQFNLGRVTVTENTVRSPNPSGISEGGGVYASVSGAGAVTVTSSTLNGNAIDGTGGLEVGGNIRPSMGTKLASTIVSGGIADTAGTENCSEKVESLGFNLESANQCGFGAAGDQVNLDPLLGPLQNNGGPTATMAPAPNSPAIDQGQSPGVAFDQRGVLRPIDFPWIPNSAAPGADGSDVGAFELQPLSEMVLGRLKRNRRRGTAVLTVFVALPDAGTVTLSGRGLRTRTKPATPTGVMKFGVIPKGKLKTALKRRGRRRVGIRVTYAPVGNSPVTRTRKPRLVRKKKIRRRTRRGHHR